VKWGLLKVLPKRRSGYHCYLKGGWVSYGFFFVTTRLESSGVIRFRPRLPHVGGEANLNPRDPKRHPHLQRAKRKSPVSVRRRAPNPQSAYWFVFLTVWPPPPEAPDQHSTSPKREPQVENMEWASSRSAWERFILLSRPS